jgi:DNA-binding IclR family transcriptional regulator
MDQAVSRALAILEALADGDAPQRISRLSEQVQLQKSTVHRILQTLIARGYVEQEADTGRYGPSLKLWELGSAIVAEHPVRRAAAPFLQALHRDVGETVSLLIPAGDDVIYLERLISPRAIRFVARPGSRVPALLTAGGRALLGHEPDLRAAAQRAIAAAGATYPGDVASTIAELQAARDRGYSISRDTPGVVSLGCAIAGRCGRPAAAISVSAPLERMPPHAQERLAQALQTTCAAVHNIVGLL